MALVAGSRLGPYEVLSPIGAGGMGEVYRARDPRLGREVALKVLPADHASDPERLRRFEQEARAVAALNHPHILAVFDVGSEGGVAYIVFELLEGQTLRRRLERGPLPARKAADYAVQICRGLSAAHARGIVHRDLKPENLFLTQEGQVKILDFGLATLRPPQAAERIDSLSPTQSAPTAAGAVLGTLGYMSPEQVRGQPADARSDLFVLGAILYEMLSGRRAFRGETAADTDAAILKQEAPEIVGGDGPVPPGLERVVRRCLEKDPEERFQSARDVAFALEALTGPSGSEVLPPLRPKRRWLQWVALVTVVTAAILLAVWITRRSASPAVGPVIPITSDEAVEVDVAFSPDGKQLAFTRVDEKGVPDLHVKLIGGGEPILITRDAFSPAWSPDGREIAFIRHVERAIGGTEDAVFVVPALGGQERQLATLGETGGGLSYSPDGRLLALPSQEQPDDRPGIFLLSLETGKKRRLTRPPPGTIIGDYLPRFSPDGRTVAFARAREAADEDVYLVPVEGGDPRRVTRGCFLMASFDWAPDGRSLVVVPNLALRVATRTLFRVPAAGGEMARSWPGIWRWERPAAGEAQRPPVRILASNLFDVSGAFSPDGRRIAFTSYRSGYAEIWVSDSDGSQPRQLTFLKGLLTTFPRWSPDGREISFFSDKPGNLDIYVVPAAGGIPRQLTSETSNEASSSWSGDGRWIYFDSSRSGRREVWKVPAAGGTATGPSARRSSSALPAGERPLAILPVGRR
jgi:Tol biopolymer transport system component